MVARPGRCAEEARKAKLSRIRHLTLFDGNKYDRTMREKTTDYEVLRSRALAAMVRAFEECTQLEPHLAFTAAGDLRAKLVTALATLRNLEQLGGDGEATHTAIKKAMRAAKPLAGLCVKLCRPAGGDELKRWANLRARLGMAMLRYGRVPVPMVSQASADRAVTQGLSQDEHAVKATELFNKLHRGSRLIDSVGHEWFVLGVHDSKPKHIRVLRDGAQRLLMLVQLASWSLKPQEPVVTTENDSQSQQNFSFKQALIKAGKLPEGA